MSRHWEQSRVHPLNNSSSKSTYAFGKTARFKSESKLLCDQFYETKEQWKTGRGAGIGKGKKTTFGDKTGYPSPSQYQVNNHADSRVRKVQGGKMSLGREHMKYGGIFNKSETPEPGKYDIRSPSPRGYTMRSKVTNLEPSYKKSPGPGAYKLSSTISASGIYTLSNLPNCLCPKIKNTKDYDASRHSRFPGPGAYNKDKENINSNGSYYVSKYSSSRCRSFSKSKNQPSFLRKGTQKLPGPGSYNYYSEFGTREASAM